MRSVYKVFITLHCTADLNTCVYSLFLQNKYILTNKIIFSKKYMAHKLFENEYIFILFTVLSF